MSQKFKSSEGRKMITMDKKYRCRDGVPVTVLAVGLNAHGSVVAVRHTTNSEDLVLTFTSDGRGGNYDHQCDLIEISPYDDFKVDDPVMVSDFGRLWTKRYFYGVDENGRPMTFCDGRTRWTAEGCGPTRWNHCRRPTPEELGE